MDVQTETGANKCYHILLIEEDAAIGRLVSLVLSAGPYRVTVCPDGESAQEALIEDPADVLLIDIALPSIAGTQLSLVRKLNKTPVIVLTDVDSEAVLVDALEAGAFDIAFKPFSPDQLEMAVALAAGADISRPSHVGILKSNVLQLDFASLRASRSGMTQTMGFSEWRFLEALATKVGQTVLYQEILRQVYGPSFREHPRLAQALAARLIKKVGLTDFHGLGYALVI